MPVLMPPTRILQITHSFLFSVSTMARAALLATIVALLAASGAWARCWAVYAGAFAAVNAPFAQF